MKTVIAVLTMTIAMSAQAQQPIRIYADASLKPALSEMAAAYPAAKLQVVYGPSAVLHERIAKGERPHVFAAANMEYPHALAKQGLSGPVRCFARNGSEYGLALVEGAGEDAWYFRQFVLSPKAQAILSKHGFSPALAVIARKE